jgi:hypothetical protein
MRPRTLAPLLTRTLHLGEAKHADVTQMVLQEFQDRGARIHEHTASRVAFDHLDAQGTFRRGGYAGIYQPVGEKFVEVLLEVWATRPRRALWAVVALELVSVVMLLAASPPSAVFFVAALVMWPLVGVAALVYVLTLRASLALEDELASGLTARFQRARLRVPSEDERLEQRIRERLEGEAAERELAQRAPPGRRGLRRASASAAGAKPAKEKRALFGRKR